MLSLLFGQGRSDYAALVTALRSLDCDPATSET